MKKVLLFLLVLVAFQGHAQVPLPAATPTHADSVATLRHVFRHARRHARLATGSYGLVLGAQALIFAVDRPTSSPARLALRVSVSALYAYFLADRVVDWGRFSRRREEEAVSRFEAHQPQPSYVQHRLVLDARRNH